MNVQTPPQKYLNGICPYFTMFPLEFPDSILSELNSDHGVVLDPFCGRGTTLYAARLHGLASVGVDSSPVATAISQAKLAITKPHRIVKAAQYILENGVSSGVPEDTFWKLAFHRDVLDQLCILRSALLDNCRSDTRKALRAVILGALHGPRNKLTPSYFSNQCQRTYAPKPEYAIKYWTKHQLKPERVDVLRIIESRAIRYYSGDEPVVNGAVIRGDSRNRRVFEKLTPNVKWVITSPPYYGMRTYIPDQWLRLWFLGAEPHVSYSMSGQIEHSCQKTFENELASVWNNVSKISISGALMVIRFGSINTRRVDALGLIENSLFGTPWRIEKVESAGLSSNGKRQATHIWQHKLKDARKEYDIYTSLES